MTENPTPFDQDVPDFENVLEVLEDVVRKVDRGDRDALRRYAVRISSAFAEIAARAPAQAEDPRPVQLLGAGVALVLLGVFAVVLGGLFALPETGTVALVLILGGAVFGSFASDLRRTR